MNKTIINVFIICAVLLVTALGVVTCTHQDESMTENIELVKSPDVLVYSNNYIIGNTKANRWRISGYNMTKWQWDTKIEGWPEATDRGEQVSTAEKDYVMQYLADHPNEGFTEINISNYFLQNVGGNYDSYEVAFMNGETVHHTTNIVGTNQMDYLEINGVHVNDFNASYGNRIYVENLPLENPSYYDSYASITLYNHYKYYFIPGYGLYLCFDYATSKYDNGQLDFNGDDIYNDWVIKIVPNEEFEIPSIDVEEPIDTLCDHVEVNLEYDTTKLTSHLSIHIRSITNIEIYIPVIAEYYCKADDLYIVQQHLDDFMIHGGPDVITYNVNGYDITLVVEYEANGIRIHTEGVSEEVIKYCQENFNDGITFEVWNYYNNIAFIEYLDLSIVTFENIPCQYINAFNEIEGLVHEEDCEVTPTQEFKDWVYGKHYNGSSYNHIYNR